MPTFGEKVEHNTDKAREAVSDKIRPDEPGLGEKASRVIRDTAYSMKEGAENAAQAVSDYMQPKKDGDDLRRDAADAIHPDKKKDANDLRRDAADAINPDKKL
eukprot:GILJ01017955.1.p2 GENE.GILJ01017955.1~~GILJ01017955.1.p2  ORF type:complete len:103 (-),score=29.04 GILJ01017955.1:37-345(-)